MEPEQLTSTSESNALSPKIVLAIYVLLLTSLVSIGLSLFLAFRIERGFRTMKSDTDQIVQAIHSTQPSDGESLRADLSTLMDLSRDISANLNNRENQVNVLTNVLHLTIQCVDSSTQLPIDCKVTAQLLAQEPVLDFSILPNQPGPIYIPAKVRLSLNVVADGYKPYAAIFEFIDDGQDIFQHQIKLEKQ